MIKCPSCGGGLRFSPQDQMLVCDYCDSKYSIKELKDKKLITAEEYKQFTGEDAEDETFETNVFTCPQCGGEILSTDETAVTFCSFCGSSVMLKSRMSREYKPDCVIPFKKTKEDCAAAYKQYLSGAIFAPADMKTEEQISKFRGIYMPYWIYSMKCDGFVNVPGKISGRKGDYIVTDHYSVSCSVKGEYDGITYDASSSFADNLSNAIAPFDMHEAVEFNPEYLSGFYADVYDVPKQTYEKTAEDVAKSDAIGKLTSNPTFGKYGADKKAVSSSIVMHEDAPRLGFFPVWFLSSRNKSGDRISYAVVNGQTGEVAADLPVAFGKYILGSIILAIPIFLILTLCVTVTPRTALIISAILGVVGLALSNMQMNRVYTKENNLDDIGYCAVNGQKNENQQKVQQEKSKSEISSGNVINVIGVLCLIVGAVAFKPLILLAVIIFIIPKKTTVTTSKGKKTVYPAPIGPKFKSLWKPIAGVAICIIMAIANPVHDYYSYIAAIIAAVLIAWCFYDIIQSHNILTTRKLPQLGARGGDENA